MLTGNDGTFGPAVVWFLILVVATFLLPRWIAPWMRVYPVRAIVLVAAVARVVPALLLDRGLPFDIEAHWWVGSLSLAGRNVYTDPLAQGRYPYPPLHQYLSAFIVWLSGPDRARFLVLDKLLPALAGIALSVVIWALAPRLEQALRAGLCYAVNPLAILVTSYHGQFDELPLLCIALALLLILRYATGRGAALAGLIVGLGVAYKTWPLLFAMPLFLLVRRWRWRALCALMVPVPLLVSLGAYGLAFGRSGLIDAVQRIHDYKGSAGFCWGYVSVVHPCWVHPAWMRPHAWIVGLNGTLLLASLVIVLALLLWRRRPLEGLVALPFVFYLFSPGWGPNYMLWVVPFAVLVDMPLALRYTAVVLPVVALEYFDALYAAYAHVAFSWAVLKPIEAALGLLGWGGVALLVVQLYSPGYRMVRILPSPGSYKCRSTG